MSKADSIAGARNTAGKTSCISVYADRLWEASSVVFNATGDVSSNCEGLQRAMEQAITNSRAESLEDALTQVILAHAYVEQVRDMARSGEDDNEKRRAEEIDLLLNSVASCLEKAIGKPRHKFSEGYLSQGGSAWLAVQEKQGS